MITFSNKYSFKKFSQQNEDGILLECVKRIGLTTGLACEFGAVDGVWLSNTKILEERGWQRKLFDVNPRHVSVTNAEITEYNINRLIPDCMVLSIDTDGNDYAIWKAYNGRPAVVIVEINSGYLPSEEVNNIRNGASYKPMVELGISKGYFLLAHTGNLVFVDIKYKNLFPEITGDGLSNADEYFNKSWLS